MKPTNEGLSCFGRNAARAPTLALLLRMTLSLDFVENL